MGTKLHIFVLSLCVSLVVSFPTDNDSLVVSSTEVSSTTEETKKEDSADSSKEDAAPSVPKIYEMNVDTNVTNRFAKTAVKSKVKNLAKSAQEATFSVVLPETAYITGFVMEIDGKSYKAYVKEKEEAKQIYNQAVGRGQAAAHVAASARDSNRFTVSVNVEPQSKAVFTLTYEELLQRQNGQYEVVLNLHPGQPVKNLNVQVHINESRPLKFVKTPPLRSGNEVAKNDASLDPSAHISIINDTSATVTFSPDVERQKQLAAGLGTKEENGLAGQFVVRYDVERDPHGGEVLLKDGYFVHFFAPSELPPLPKQVVFVLDTSGSMDGIRIKQLKEAMNSILAELKPEDIFNIVEFSSSVKVWNIPKVEVQYEEGEDPWNYYSEEAPKKKNKTELPPAFEATKENIEKAKEVVKKLNAYGGTDIKSALEVGLQLVKKNREDKKEDGHQPIVVFLTDGEPTVGETNTERIISSISEVNNGIKRAPIFSLSFGDGADRDFLQKISLKNSGFARHIYEAADASLQLQEFYKQISSPLLSNVEFKYVSNVTKVTKRVFPIFFHGSELVVAGEVLDEGFAPPICTGHGAHGPVNLVSKVENPVGDLERLWAYLTVKQILEDRDAAEHKENYTKKALDIALKYSFVTPVSSLVVVKPNDTRPIDTEDASKTPDRPYFANRHYALGGSFSGPPPTLSLGSPLIAQQPAFATGYSGQSFQLSSAVQPTSLLINKNAFEADVDSDVFDEEGPVDIRVAEEAPSTTVAPSPPKPPTTVVPTEATTAAVAESTTAAVAESTTAAVAESTTTTEKSDIYEDLKTKLPWLKDVLAENGTLTVAEGNYELSLDATITEKPECPKTPGNETAGTCTLLSQCPQVFEYLIDVKTFEKYFCPLEKYAGICCPPVEEETASS